MAVTPQTNVTLVDLAARLCESDSFALCGHVSPDGDCIGSQLTLAHALRALGKDVVCLLAKPEPLDAGLRSLPGAAEMVPAVDYTGTPEAFIACDVPAPARLGDAAAVQERCARTFTIDHHAVPTTMSEHNYVDPDAPATALIMWELVKELGVEPTPELAQCAYAGLMTDTGGFRHQNTDVRAFEAAAEMVRCGADPSQAANDLLNSRTIASLRLEQRMLERAVFDKEAQFALSSLTAEDFAACGAVKADAEPLIDTLRSVAGLRVAGILREQGDVVRGSLRAKDGTDVAAIAHGFGGGGHRAAAGFTFEGTMEEAVVAVDAAIRVALGAPAAGMDA